MAVLLYYKSGPSAVNVPLGQTMTRETVTVTDPSVTSYTVTASFTSLQVLLDGFLCEPTVTYTISGQVVTFLDTLPVGTVISFISYK